MNIILAGRGRMADAFRKFCLGQQVPVTNFGGGTILFGPHSDKPVAIHFGSGSQLPSLIDLCEQFRIPIIQGSTDLTQKIPTGRNVVIINAPNLSLQVIRLMSAFPAFAAKIESGMALRVVESHQEGKADASGTARAMVNELGLPDSIIESIRRPGAQRLLGVPEEHLSGHAYHDFIFTGQGVEIAVSVKINGRQTYAEGALAIAKGLANMREPLKSGFYNLENIFHLLTFE